MVTRVAYARVVNRSVSVTWLVLALVVSAGTARAADAREWYSHRYGANDGLSSVVNTIAQDRDGYLWLATQSGLIRFDGFEFSAWGSRGEPALPSKNIFSLIAASDGGLWVGLGGSGGVSRIRDGQLITYPTEDGVPFGVVRALLEAHDGTIFAGSRLGLSRFVRGQWEQVDLQAGAAAATSVTSIFQDSRQALWVATPVGVFVRSSEGPEFRLVSRRVVSGFGEDQQGRLWVTDPRLGVTTLLAHASGDRLVKLRASHLLCDRNGTLWIGTLDDGLWRIVPADTRPQPHLERIELVDESVSTIFQDRDGDIWVGTRQGLVRLFRHDATMMTRADGLLSDTVRAVLGTRDGSIWIASVNGLDRLPPAHRTGRTQHPLPHTRVSALHEDSAGRLWVGVDGALAVVTDGALADVPLPQGAAFGTVFAMASDAEGGLWLCHLGHTSPARWHQGTLTHFGDRPEIAGRACISAYTDSTRRPWFGLSDGSLVGYADGQFRAYTRQDGLSGAPIFAIYRDTSDALWIGTSDGLVRLKDGQSTIITERNGLPDSDVKAIVEDQDGNLWCAFSAGLIRLNKTEVDQVARNAAHRVRYSFFDASDGVLNPPSRAGTPTGARGSDGTLWFVTTSGVVLIDPRRVGRTRHVMQARLERAVADGRILDPTNDFVLPPRTSTLELNYAALGLVGASKVRFSYMLEGFDHHWIEAGRRRQAFYTRLAPGQYTFRVRAFDGTDESTAAWEFAVQPAFYQRSCPFYAACLAVAALCVWGGWQLRLKKLRREFALVGAERARISREIHDTLLQGMAGIALKLETVASQVSPHAARRELRRMRQQVERQMGEAREAILNLRGGPPTDRTLTSALQRSGHELVSSGPARFELVTRGSSRAYPPAIEQQLLEIAREAIRNATRHAHASRISVELDYEPDAVRLKVSDDGRGFQFDDATAGVRPRWGLTGMAERARSIGGALRVVSSHDTGTTIEAHIPTTPADLYS